MSVKLGTFNKRSEQLDGTPQWRAIVLSVHGINTTGPWQKSISPVLNDSAFKTVGADYGFHLLRIARPKSLLKRAKAAIWELYEKHHGANLPFCAIGHSFGTLALGSLMMDNRDAQFDRVILTGSILARDFNWKNLIDAGQVNSILNEVSKNDAIVKKCWMLKVISPSLAVGRSGSHGFLDGCERVRQRYHSMGHSEVLNDVACKKTWIPFLRSEG